MIDSVAKRAFRGSRGTYNVHALELAAARQHKLKKLSVTVRFLDDTEHVFHVEKCAKGGAILEQVYQYLELVEKDYFGLQYSDSGCAPLDNRPESMRWIDANKRAKKQLANCHHPIYFRVKFYVSDPSKLHEEFTRYQFYLQLRRDILEGRLLLPCSTAILLASFTAQSELGDYQSDEHNTGYLTHLQLLPGQNRELEEQICELHKLHKGQLPADAEYNFLDHVKRMEMYGVELHKAKDTTGKDIKLGVTNAGLVVFQNTVRMNTFSWSKVMKISFKRKQFFIQLRRELSEDYDTLLGFNMETYRSSKTLWKSCVEHHTFFRLHSPKVRRRFPLLFGSKFMYSGRTEFQTMEEVRRRDKLQRKFIRTSINKCLIRQQLQTTCVSSPPPKTDDSIKRKTAAVLPYETMTGNKVTAATTFGTQPKKAWTEEDTSLSDDDGGFLDRALEGPFLPGIANRVMTYADEEAPSSPVSTSGGLYETPPYSDNNHSPTHSHIMASSPTGPGVAATPGTGTNEEEEEEVTLVTITLQPDDDGKYGFNVKGGTSEDVPILVSKVAPNTPADKCVPRLAEGDQLLQINSTDVAHALHHQVVDLVQAARTSYTGTLVLTVAKPLALNLCNAGGVGGAEEEPPFQYVPISSDALGYTVDASRRNAPLDQSMLLLADGLASGALLTQYEMLYRRHPDLFCDVSNETGNLLKNRYRDILPYDATRVVLQDGATGGDYINANHVNMLISGTEIVNQYIATQGPLSTTVDDFWQMCLEQRCHLIVMLTTLMECDRPKCHQYWPNLGDTLATDRYRLICVTENTHPSGSYVIRDFSLVDLKQADYEERHVRHMQYVAWPDHGVPESPLEFLQFTEQVRETRTKCTNRPVVVHCSAGIGRTGVLVLMETALCLMEHEEPVYPLEIVRTMREQRAMMIQNASQYRFVCECVHSAYLKRLGSEQIKG